MPNVSETTPTKKEAAEPAGYSQELKRTLGPAQVFAISFAFISVAVGIFGTYDDVLRNAGPIGIWLWVIPTVGQTLVALVIAQFAARISLAGSSYQWASSPSSGGRVVSTLRIFKHTVCKRQASRG